MSGYRYGEKMPTVCCPWCGGDVTGTAEYVDIGVGIQQVSAHACQSCQAVEISPFDERTYTQEEMDKGWTHPLEYAAAHVSRAPTSDNQQQQELRKKLTCV